MSDLPPHDLHAEDALVAALMINPDLDPLELGLTAEAFYSGGNAQVFDAITALVKAGKGVDLVTVGTKLKDAERLAQVGGMGRLTELLNAAPRVSAAAVAEYAAAIREKHKARQVIDACRLAIARAQHGECDAAGLVERVHAIDSGEAKGHSVMLHDALKSTFKSICDHAARGGGMTGISSGFPDLDRVMSGLHAGDFTVIAGRPGMGKSAFAQAIAVNVARLGHGVALFNLEMKTEQTTTRIMCADARVDLTHPRQGIVTDGDFKAYAAVLGDLARLPILLDDNGSATLEYIRSVTKRYARQLESKGQKLGLLVLDYIQLVNCKGSKGNREQEIAEVSRFCKEFAKEMSIAVVGLAQLNRGLESRQDKRPMLSDLRESGSLEQDADNVVFIYRDEQYNPHSEDKGTAEVIVRKQRSGPCDTVRVAFEARSTAFRSLASHDR